MIYRAIEDAPVAAPAGLERYCRNLDHWPHLWMGWEKDLPPGEELVACFRPFLEHLVGSDVSPKTIQKHVDNLWVLGGRLSATSTKILLGGSYLWTGFFVTRSTRTVAR